MLLYAVYKVHYKKVDQLSFMWTKTPSASWRSVKVRCYYTELSGSVTKFTFLILSVSVKPEDLFP